MLQVRPPDSAPAVSRVSTDVTLLAEALRAGHEAADTALRNAALGPAPTVVRPSEA